MNVHELAKKYEDYMLDLRHYFHMHRNWACMKKTHLSAYRKSWAKWVFLTRL